MQFFSMLQKEIAMWNPMIRLPLLKTYSDPRICGDDPVPGKRVKTATKLYLIRQDGSYCAGSDWRSAVGKLSRTNQRRRND